MSINQLPDYAPDNKTSSPYPSLINRWMKGHSITQYKSMTKATTQSSHNLTFYFREHTKYFVVTKTMQNDSLFASNCRQEQQLARHMNYSDNAHTLVAITSLRRSAQHSWPSSPRQPRLASARKHFMHPCVCRSR